jgi:hypothetical protein
MNPEDYIECRNRLAKDWTEDNSFMSLIEPSEQWDLHAYFEFHKDKNDDEALSHQANIAACEPDLEVSALAAFRRLVAELNAAHARATSKTATPAPTARSGRKHDYQIEVRSVVRPELDARLMAEVVIGLARQLAAEAAAKESGVWAPPVRCDATPDGRHPDLRAYIGSSPKSQPKRFLACCHAAIQEVDREHIAVEEAAFAVSGGLSCPAIADDPILGTLARLALDVAEKDAPSSHTPAWRKFVGAVGRVKDV